MNDAQLVRQMAEIAIAHEEFQHAVEKEKARLRRRARLKRLVLSLLKPWRSL